jgi:TPR repeat protein
MASRPAYSSIGLRLLDGACTKGDGEACAELASGLSITAHYALEEPDDKRRTELRAKACKAGYADACEDRKQQLALHEKACKASDARACLAASWTYEPAGTKHPDDPSEDDESEDRALAVEEAIKAGIMKPNPVKPDAKKAKQLRARALMLIAQACAHSRARTCSASRSYGTPQLELGCKAGASNACRRRAFAGIGLAEMVDPVTAVDAKQLGDFVTYGTRACELGDTVACGALAAGYEAGDHGLEIDHAKALAFETKQCDAHDGSACAGLGKRSDDGRDMAKDPAKALVLYLRACDEGNLHGCAQAGDSLVAGTRGATKDAKKAIELYTRACELQDRDSALLRPICGELAKRYDDGTDVAKDPAKAKSLRQQGCKRGEKTACTP